MKSYKDYLKELPSRIGEVEIDLKGSVTGFPFKGTFTCRIPSVNDYIMADKKRAVINGGVPDEELDLTIAQTTQMIAYLSVVLEESPKWWKEDLKNGADCLDINLILVLHSKVKEFEKDWKAKVWGSDESEEKSKKDKK